LLVAFKATAVGGTRVKSVWEGEREREREREREFKYMGMLRGKLLNNPERERWRECARGEEEVHEEESLGGSVGEREGSLGSRKEKSFTPET